MYFYFSYQDFFPTRESNLSRTEKISSFPRKLNLNKTHVKKTKTGIKAISFVDVGSKIQKKEIPKDNNITTM